jgi:hypothetical protein
MPGDEQEQNHVNTRLPGDPFSTPSSAGEI